MNHDFLYSVRIGVLSGISISVLLALFVFYAYPIFEQNIEKLDLEEKIRKRGNKYWDILNEEGNLTLSFYSMLGGIEIELGEISKIRGSKYILQKFLAKP